MGRWLNRDPSKEIGGFNLYGFTQNNPINEYDLFGLWISSTHSRLTYWSWQQAEVNEVMRRYAIPFLRILQKKNVAVDTGLTENIMAWHFNRSLDVDGETAKTQYKELLNEQLSGNDGFLTLIKKNEVDGVICQKALESLGKLSHAWQDYFAHGIRKEKNGVLVYYSSAPGTIEGSPDNIPSSIIPAKWGYFGWKFWNINFSEHGMTEPGFRAPDSTERLALAQNFVTQKYNILLSEWWESCKCYRDEIKE